MRRGSPLLCIGVDGGDVVGDAVAATGGKSAWSVMKSNGFDRIEILEFDGKWVLCL